MEYRDVETNKYVCVCAKNMCIHLYVPLLYALRGPVAMSTPNTQILVSKFLFSTKSAPYING